MTYQKNETGPDSNSLCLDLQNKTNGANSGFQLDLERNDDGLSSNHQSSDENENLTHMNKNDLNSKKCADLKS